MILRPNSRSCRTASIRSGRAGGLAGELTEVVTNMTLQTECAFVTDGYSASPPPTNISETENDALRTLLALHAIALGAMSHGICVLDADGRVALFNRRLLEIFKFSPDIMCVG